MKSNRSIGLTFLSAMQNQVQQLGWIGVAAAATLLVVGPIGSSTLPAKESSDGDSDSHLATAVDLESFDDVWTTIHKTHWDLDEEKWDLAKKELRGKAESAKTRGEVRKVITELLERLGQSHFGLIPSEALDVLKETEEIGAADDDTADGNGDSKGRDSKDGIDGDDDGDDDGDGDGKVELDIRYRSGKLTVVRVAENSGAAKAGVQPGWIVTKLGKRTDAELLDAAKAATDRGPVRMDTLVGFMCEKAMHGRVGKRLKIEFTDSMGQTQSPELRFASLKGKTVGFGHFPKIRVRHSTKHLKESDVTYFAFNVFFDPPGVMSAFRQAIEQARDTKGLIIDVRGNLGGIGGMTFGMASAFVDEPGKMGVMKMKNQELTFPLFPALEPYEGTVAVLIDECSASSAEIFSGGLADLGLARLFGKQTAGLALPSNIKRLPNGDGFQYAFATYTSASGKVLEGVGVTPHESIVPTAKQLAMTADPVLHRAVEWILEQQPE